MNYYIIHNGQQVGPMPKEQLKAYGLCPTSKVWCEGMPNWADASTVADLQSMLYPQQPPMPTNFPPQQQRPIGSPYLGNNGYGQQPYGNNQHQEVSFGDAIKICFNKYADFEGRARRSEFWWWRLFLAIVNMAFQMVVTFTFGGATIFVLLVSFALLIPDLAVGARRLHDTGRSGWLQLLMLTCVGFIPLIIWWCEDSKGDNEYGPSPKYPGNY